MWTQRVLVVFLIIAASVLAPGRESLAQAQRFTTPWGHPDLQGVWNNPTPVAFERPKYESDCHEGNYGLANILRAARVEEKKR